MICPECEGVLKVENSYTTPAGRTQRLSCKDCGIVATSVTFLVNVEPKQGEGAYAIAQKMRNGKKWAPTGGTGEPIGARRQVPPS